MNGMKCRVIDNEVYEKYVLHSFVLYDCEDPIVEAGAPIYKWQQTPAGKFCMEKAKDLEFHKMVDHHTMGYRIAITGWLRGKHATFYSLKKT